MADRLLIMIIIDGSWLWFMMVATGKIKFGYVYLQFVDGQFLELISWLESPHAYVNPQTYADFYLQRW